MKTNNRIRQTIPTENKLVENILALSTIFFLTGFISDFLVVELTDGNTTFWENFIASLLLIALYVVYKTKKIKLQTALIIHIVIIFLKLSYYVVHKLIAPSQMEDIFLNAAECVLVLPIIFAGLTRWKPFTFVLSAISILLYSAAAITTGSILLIQCVPTYFFVFFGVSISVVKLVDMARRNESEKMEEIEKQLVMSRFFGLDPGQLKLMRSGKMTREKADKLLNKHEKSMERLLIHKVKEVMHTEGLVKAAVRAQHPHLTARDLQLCCHIVDNLSVDEIGHLRNITHTSVTSHRSRLRTKLGLAPGEDLKDYLNKVVAETRCNGIIEMQ